MIRKVQSHCEICRNTLSDEENYHILTARRGGGDGLGDRRPGERRRDFRIINYCNFCYRNFVKDKLFIEILTPIDKNEVEYYILADEVLNE